MELDRLFSHHLPGQELAVLVGQLVWNLRICRGFEMDPPPAIPERLKPRSRRVDDRPLLVRPLSAESPPEETVMEGTASETVSATPEEETALETTASFITPPVVSSCFFRLPPVMSSERTAKA